MLRISTQMIARVNQTFSESLAAPDVFHHAAILDFPKTRSFLNVFEPTAHLLLERLFVDELLAQRLAHLAPELVVFGEDLVDVGRVHQHLDELVEHVVDGVVADLDALLIGDELRMR